MRSASREDSTTPTAPTAQVQAVVTAVIFVQALSARTVAANVWAATLSDVLGAVDENS